MPDDFGDFHWICQHAPLPQCNLFFNQLWNRDSEFLTTLFPTSSDFYNQYDVDVQSSRDDANVMTARRDSGTGLGANCEIPWVSHRGSIGDVALVVLSAVALIVTVVLISLASRRRAAVGRVELRLLLGGFALHSALQIITMSSLLEQGTTALTVLSAIHIALIVSFFWVLLGNAIVATQVVEDGTPAAVVPLCVIAALFFAPTLYIALDIGLHWTETFRIDSSDPSSLRSITLFVLTLIWPAFAAVANLGIMLFIVSYKLREVKPAIFYVVAFAMFVGGQVIFFLASQPLCDASNQKVNGAFLTTFLNIGAIGMIYLAWLMSGASFG
ncbi:chitin synthase III catalytic subunit-domain-containing protein [Kockovaella imperatae]|uniref:Chitin synthase III catalytic subunit-domain-containing protein n=1 Tax=Kockovaella imperatae TaxID=4999 RepID=A0A1Y1UVB6_9TREE|nr:chitin synthase III catalytic subunit-domain-containing protein [Kockovaella imperatae]ORX41155.1 chitin synthase III catalytic subunit-domain-containing protein [Kockovaella imperatae]